MSLVLKAVDGVLLCGKWSVGFAPMHATTEFAALFAFAFSLGVIAGARVDSLSAHSSLTVANLTGLIRLGSSSERVENVGLILMPVT